MKNLFVFLLSVFGSLIIIQSKAQTELPLIYSPDSRVVTTISKGDTLIVGGYFKNVGKYTGGGTLLSTISDDPAPDLPKINGNIIASVSDGNGGFYIYGVFFKESEHPSDELSRIEHILANNTFDPNFSIFIEGGTIGYLFFYRGILYMGNGDYGAGIINGQQLGTLAGLNVNTKALVSWLPTVSKTNSRSSVKRIFAKGNTLYFIGSFDNVGGVARKDVAAIKIQTGEVKPWFPGNNWGAYSSYNDIVFYKDKVIIGGSFNNVAYPSDHSCAIVDTLSGQNFTYLFQSDCSNNPSTCLNASASVSRLAMKNDTLFVFSSGTIDTRATALNMKAFVSPVQNGTIWKKYFNNGSAPSDMAVIGGSLFLTGSNFKEVYLSGQTNNSPANIERKIKGGAKLNLTTGALENWFIDPVGYTSNSVLTMSSEGNKIFIGGLFSHLKGLERIGVYMMNTQTETILPFDAGLLNSTVEVLKLVGNTLYICGSLTKDYSTINSVLAYDVNTGIQLNWGLPTIGVPVIAMDVNEQYVFIGGYPSSQGKQNLVAFDRNTGQLINTWAPNPDARINSLHIANNQLYIGGNFTAISGQNRNRVAAYNLSDLSLNNWNPDANDEVKSIYAKNGLIWLGGAFTTVGGVSRKLHTNVDPISGATVHNTNSNLMLYGTYTSFSKGCKLFVAGSLRLKPDDSCNSLTMIDLTNNSFVSPNDFCLNLQSFTGGKIHSLSTAGNDLFFGGSFNKINSHSKNPNIGRIRFQSSYFTPCEISNCNNTLSLASDADDYTTGTYIQKTNKGISASNAVSGHAQISLKSNAYILLLPNTISSTGFVAKPESGGSFKAEIGPCN